MDTLSILWNSTLNLLCGQVSDPGELFRSFGFWQLLNFTAPAASTDWSFGCHYCQALLPLLSTATTASHNWQVQLLPPPLSTSTSNFFIFLFLPYPPFPFGQSNILILLVRWSLPSLFIFWRLNSGQHRLQATNLGENASLQIRYTWYPMAKKDSSAL